MSLALAACLGCTGKIDDATLRPGGGSQAGTGATSGSGSTTGGGSGTGAVSGGGTPTLVAGELDVPYTRLTRVEYQATVQAAFSVTPDVSGIPNDSRIGPFTSNVGSPDPAQEFLLASEDLAAQIVPAKLPTCTGATAATCVKTNYQAPIERLYRRSLTAAEVTSLANMISPLEAAGVTSQDATRAMLVSALLSADFLFRSAPLAGDAARGRRLSEHLGYALWDAPPDATLVAAGAVTPSQLGASLKEQALRLGADARAVPVLARFLAQWLRVDTDDKLDDPNLSFATSPLYAELLAFVQNALTKNVPVKSFVNGTQGFIQKNNFAAYAMSPVSSSANVVPVTWTASSVRRGILGEEVFMDATRNPDPGRRPIFRGHLVRSSLLCQPIASPPAELVALNTEVTDRTTDTRCAACHSLMDPIGKAFAPNDLDNTIGTPAPVVNGSGEVSGSFEDLPSLMDAIAGSQAYADCFSRNLLAFFLEQDPDLVDAASIGDVSAVVKSGGSLADAIGQAVVSLEKRSQSSTPWCTGQ
ncbi:MAG TPA: DUF1588 domain-containing protein [Polyangia bacterium]|nr:DUF1588 domain-containing protein [Polyangia bacterium]